MMSNLLREKLLDDSMNQSSIDLVENIAQENMKSLYELADYREKNNFLNSQLQKAKDSLNTITIHYEANIDKRDKIIQKLRSELERTKSEVSHDINVAKAESKLQIQQMKDNHFMLETELREDLEIAQVELKELIHFRDMKIKAKEKMAELEQMVKLLEEKCTREKNEQEQRGLFELSKINKSCESRIFEIEKRARSKARNDFGIMVTKIIQDNKHLSNELQSQLSIVSSLQKEKCEAHKNIKQAHIEINIQKDKEGEYANQLHELLKEKKYLLARIEKLEQETERRKREYFKQNEESSAQMADTTQKWKHDQYHLKSILDRKDRELKQMKQLVKKVIDQRSDVEEFLSESLIHITDKIEKKRKSNNTKNDINNDTKVTIYRLFTF